jgi:ABC-type Zn2+ transport system substrate-binding protein/surface adhesin
MDTPLSNATGRAFVEGILRDAADQNENQHQNENEHQNENQHQHNDHPDKDQT